MSYSRYVILFLSLLLVCLIGLTGRYFINFKDHEPKEINDSNNIIAVLNGEKLTYQDIQFDQSIKGLPYLQGQNTKELDDEIHKQEIRRLAVKIRDSIFMKNINEFGITATQKEIHSRVEQNFATANIDKEKAEEICKNIRVVYEALLEWQKDTSRADAIYNEKLSSFISRDQWDLYKACYDTPEKIKKMVVPKNIEDMKKNSMESSKKDVLYQKLYDIITKDISVTDKEIKDAYVSKYSHLPEKPPIEEVIDELRSELLNKKKQKTEALWWQDQYRQAKIEIYDSKFKNVWNILQNKERPES